MRTRRSSTNENPNETDGTIGIHNDTTPLLPPPPTATATTTATMYAQGRRPPPPPPLPPPTNRISEHRLQQRTEPSDQPVHHHHPSVFTVNTPTSPIRIHPPSPQSLPTPVLSPQQQHQQQQRPQQQSVPNQQPQPMEGIHQQQPAAAFVNDERRPQQTQNRTAESIDWILQVRLPKAGGTANQNGTNTSSKGQQQQQQQQQSTSTIRKIHMTTNSNMDVTTLADCLQQCLNYTTPIIAGLFCETTQIFYSLQHILKWDNEMIIDKQQSIYCIELIQQQQPTIHINETHDHYGFWWWWYDLIVDQIVFITESITSNWYILVPLLIAIIVYYHYNIVNDSLYYTYTTFYETVIEQPLRDLYRYGPWFIGWEGDDISIICARITYHGDAQFWLRNTIECNRIYTAKEEAFLRISRPIIYIILTVVLIYIIRFLIQEYQTYQFQLHNQNRNPLERDMADLYHSFHVILRQIMQVHHTQQQQQVPPGNRSKGRSKK